VLFFPFVGLLIGLLLAGLYGVLHSADAGVLAVLLLAAWALLTGGLHLDGLADTADAWIGGHGDKEKSLAIMKDPHSGPIAIMIVVLVLLAKFATLKTLLTRNAWEILVWVPVLGRTAILLMLVTTPYVRPQGMGVRYADHLPRTASKLLLLGVVAVIVWRLRWNGITLMLLLGSGFIGLHRLSLKWLGGTTGDTLGATCELTETAALAILSLLVG
jgi:adenosylcobinamide-GDP ribazoletransferase